LEDIFDDDSLELTPKLSARDACGWSGFIYICLIFTVEKKFKIKASTSEIGKLENVCNLIGFIQGVGIDQSLGAIYAY
jgi:acyl carrier protein